MRTDIAKKFVTVLGFAFGLYLVVVILQPILFANKFGVNSYIAGVNVSYKTREKAVALLETRVTEYQKSKVNLGDVEINVSDYLSDVNVDETVNEALLTEQSGYLAISKLGKHRHEVHTTLNNDNIAKLLIDNYYKVAASPFDANIVVNGETKVVPEKAGQRLMLAESRKNITQGFRKFSSTVSLYISPQAPMMTATEAGKAVDRAKSVVSEPVTLLGDGVSYTISATDLRSWLKITPTSPKTLVALENFFPIADDYYYLDPNKVFLFVDTLAKQIDKTAANATLSATNGKVIVAQKEQIGLTVNRKDAIIQIQEAVTGDRVASLTIDSVKPEIRSDNLTELGLTELVSTGWTDFTGSPANRIHNVQTGASKFNGVLIKSDEDFSFNKALGPVEASTGYLPELVILADKTVPEFGGGLCQVSSTAFRAALNAGLPILERHAHAYPVSYYKPYGVDATIYLPTPDLRFKNDTGKYIFVQTRIVGKKLYFDFYGTKKPGTIKFSGNAEATGAVDLVEKVTPTLTEQDARGPKSFTAVFYRHIYDATGKLTDNDKFTSKYDSPDKYPH